MTVIRKPPTEPRKEDFGLNDDDIHNVKKFHQNKEYTPGITLGAGLMGAGMAFMGVLFVGVLPVACTQAGGSLLVTVAGVVAFIAFIKIVSSSTEKVDVSQDTISKHSKYEIAKDSYHKEFLDYQLTQEDHWFSMSGHQFEHEFGKLLEVDGYKVTYTQGSGDGGVDLIASKNGIETIIQCKAWKNPVGPSPVRELQGVREPGQDAWMVGLGGFTEGATEFAKQKGIKTITYRQVAETVQRQLLKNDMKNSIDSGGSLII